MKPEKIIAVSKDLLVEVDEVEGSHLVEITAAERRLYDRRATLAERLANFARRYPATKTGSEENHHLFSKGLPFTSYFDEAANRARDIYVVGQVGHIDDEYESERYSSASLIFYVEDVGEGTETLTILTNEQKSVRVLTAESLPSYYMPLRHIDEGSSEDLEASRAMDNVEETLESLRPIYSV